MVKINISDNEWLYANDKFVEELNKRMIFSIKNYGSLS